MKGIIWKELRQWWLLVLLLLIGQGIWIGWQMEFEIHPGAQVKGTRDAYLNTASGAVVMAILLALLQTVPEMRRDPRSFLMHRGLSATRIFLGKVVAGFAMYAAILLVPVLIAFGVCWWYGADRQPFSWQQLIPVLFCIFAAFSLYFGTLIALIYNGPWLITRAIPFISSICLTVGCLANITEVSEYGTSGGYLLLTGGLAMLALAAWGVFVRHGEAAGRPALGTFGLGATLISPIMLGFFTLFIMLFTGIYSLLDGIGIYNTCRTHYKLGPDGHVFRFDLEQYSKGNPYDRRIEAVTDLDAPASTVGDSLVGKTLNDANRLQVPGFLNTNGVWQPQSSWFDKPLGFSTRIQQTIDSKWHSGDPRHNLPSPLAPQSGEFGHWIFSRPDGLVYIYRVKKESRFNLWSVKGSQLVAVIGPDGFTSPAERPQQRFGNLLATTSGHRIGFHSTWESVVGTPEDQFWFYLLCEEALYRIDLDARSVTRVFTAPYGKRIRSLNRQGDEIAVLYDDSIDVHRAITIPPPGKERAWVPHPIYVPGELAYSFPVPRQFSRYQRFEFVRVPGTDEVILTATDLSPAWMSERIVRMKLDGTIVRASEFRQTESMMSVPALIAIPLLPTGPVLLVCGVSAAINNTATGPSGLVFGFVQNFPGTATMAIVELMLISCGCCGLAHRISLQSGFDSRTRRNWLIWSFLFGPAGLVMLWFLRDWPAKETCASCSRTRPVDCDFCPHCRAPTPTPELRGVEIFTGDSAPILLLQPK